MMLEELIRCAIDGIVIANPDLSPRNVASKIQELVDILIDFSDFTDKDLREILADYTRYVK